MSALIQEKSHLVRVEISCDLFKKILQTLFEHILCVEFVFDPKQGMSFSMIDSANRLMIDGIISVSNFHVYAITERVSCIMFVSDVLDDFTEYVSKPRESSVIIYPYLKQIEAIHYNSRQPFFTQQLSQDISPLVHQDDQLYRFGVKKVDNTGLILCNYYDYKDYLVTTQSSANDRLIHVAVSECYLIHLGICLPLEKQEEKMVLVIKSEKSKLVGASVQGKKKTIATKVDEEKKMDIDVPVFLPRYHHTVLFSYVDCLNEAIQMIHCKRIDPVIERYQLLQLGLGFGVAPTPTDGTTVPNICAGDLTITTPISAKLTHHCFPLRHYDMANKIDFEAEQILIGLSHQYGYLKIIPIVGYGVSDTLNQAYTVSAMSHTSAVLVNEMSFIRFRLLHLKPHELIEGRTNPLQSIPSSIINRINSF